MRLGPLNVRATPRGYLRVRVGCPPRWPSKVNPLCSGMLSMEGTRRKRGFKVKPGRQQVIRFRLTRKRLKRLTRARQLTLNYIGRVPDPAGGTYTRSSANVLAAKPRPKKPRR